jgi:hypothetical protein
MPGVAKAPEDVIELWIAAVGVDEWKTACGAHSIRR